MRHEHPERDGANGGKIVGAENRDDAVVLDGDVDFWRLRRARRAGPRRGAARQGVKREREARNGEAMVAALANISGL